MVLTRGVLRYERYMPALERKLQMRTVRPTIPPNDRVATLLMYDLAGALAIPS